MKMDQDTLDVDADRHNYSVALTEVLEMSYAAFIWTGEYGVSHFTSSELHSSDFTSEHQLWTGGF